jgi:hypothetical protein
MSEPGCSGTDPYPPGVIAKPPVVTLAFIGEEFLLARTPGWS